MCRGSSEISHTDFNHGFFEATHAVTPSGGNLVASPVSVLVLLSALLSARGPEGRTARQICEGLVGRRRREECENADFTKIEATLEKIRVGVEGAKNREGQSVLSMANALFMDKEMKINPGFGMRFARLRGDTFDVTNFKTDEAFNDINKWTNDATDGLIEKFYDSEDALSKETLMVLLNAIAFKDNWHHQFDVELTKNATFRQSEKQSFSVPMMNLEKMLPYSERSDFKFVVLPMKTNRFKFVVFLPRDDFDVDDIEDELEDDFDWTSVDEAAVDNIRVTLPKFKIEHETDLKAALKKLGIVDLFTRGKANLKGISETPVYAGEAKHKAMLEIDENGVKAAAVSGISIMPMMVPPPAKPFIVDQPFYCALYDSELKMPLFFARVIDPR